MSYIPIKFGMSSGGNTSGSSGTVSNQIIFAGGNNVTLSQSTNGGNATITISAPNASSNTFGMSNIGNTSGTSGTINGAAAQVLFAGGNNVTLSQSLNGSSATITISGPTTAAQTNQSLGLYALGNTTQNSSTTRDARSLSFNGLGAVTMGYSNGSIQVSAPVQSTQTQNLHNITLSGNTAGVMAQVSSGTMTLAGGNNITLSQNGNAITISGGAGGAGGSNTFGMSNLGNTSGTSGTINGSAVQFAFAGGDNVTLSQSINGSSGTITISAAAVGAGSFSAGISTGGNTSGTTGTVANQVVFVGGNNVTLSQSANAQSATITISAGAGGAAQTLSRYQNMDRGTSSALAIPVGTLMMQRLNQENDLFAGNMTASTWLMNMSGTASSGASSTQTLAAHSTTVRIGIYAPVATANSVLTLLNSVSSTFGSNNTMSIYPHYFGNRWLSIHSSQWSSAPAFSQGGDYVFAILINTSGASTGLSYLGQNYMNSNQRSGYWGVSTTTGNTTMPHGNYWNAIYSASSSGLPGNISGNQVNRVNASAIFIPHIIMNNQYTY